MFEIIDWTGDGFIQLNEFKLMIQEISAGQKIPTKEIIENLFAGSDINSDGKLSKEEVFKLF